MPSHGSWRTGRSMEMRGEVTLSGSWSLRSRGCWEVQSLRAGGLGRVWAWESKAFWESVGLDQDLGNSPS